MKFVKGIEYLDALQRLEKIEGYKRPYILHFRFATIGEKHDKLCHPFPITADKELLFALKGEAKAVLAHNGTWRSWPTAFSEDAVERLEKAGWSDSSIIAWLIGKGHEVSLPQYGYGHRIATLSASKGLKLFGDWWTDSKTGISYSNRHWQSTKFGDSCSFGTTGKTTYRGNSSTTNVIVNGRHAKDCRCITCVPLNTGHNQNCVCINCRPMGAGASTTPISSRVIHAPGHLPDCKCQQCLDLRNKFKTSPGSDVPENFSGIV